MLPRSMLLLSASLLIAPCAPAAATEESQQPFGFKMGDPLEASLGCEPIDARIPFSEGWYDCQSSPQPDPAFVSYGVLTLPEIGLCAVSATTESFTSDRNGTEARRRVDLFVQQLAAQYGPGVPVDRIEPDSMWDGPEYWLFAVHMNQREYGHLWESKTLYPGNDDLQWIKLRLRSDPPKARVMVLFSFSNASACVDAQLKAKKAD